MLYADENIPLKIVQRLCSEGYAVTYVPRSLPDREILAKALAENALILTYDSDFSSMVLDEGRPTAGIIVIRISFRVPVEDEAQIIVEMLRRYSDKLFGACCFLSETVADIRHPLS